MINKLSLGEFLLSCGGIQTPVLVQAPDTRTVLSVPEDVSDDYVANKMSIEHLKPFMSCKCRIGCDLLTRNQAEAIARRLISKIKADSQSKEMLNNKERLDNYIKLNLNDALEPMVDGYDNDKKLMRCAAMQFERMASQEISF